LSRYAADTEVSVDKSRAEIERILQRYGSPEDGFAYRRKGNRASTEFEFRDITFRLVLPLPDPNAEKFQWTPSRRKKRTDEGAQEAWEQACKQSWRALALVVKAKLEAVESGIATFGDEFLAYRVLPNGLTVSEEIGPKLDGLPSGGTMLALLPKFEVKT